METPPQESDQAAHPREPGLPTLGVRREVRVAGIRIAGRRRRPSGERAALERQLQLGGRLWLTPGISMVGVWISLFTFPATTDWWTRQDNGILGWLVGLRTNTLTSVADGVILLGTPAYQLHELVEDAGFDLGG